MAASTEISKIPAQLITVAKQSSLGLSLAGEISRTEGPLIYVKDIIPGGDCHTDGRLRPGDQLVSVNKESLCGVSCEEAKSILNRVKLRGGSVWEITFIRPSENCPEQTSRSEHTAQTQGTSSPYGHAKPAPMKENRNLHSSQPRGSSDTPLSGRSQGPGPDRVVSLNPDARFKADKLELALNYLGLNPTEEQQLSIRQRVHLDANGTVAFGDFVQVVKSLFSLQLEEGDIGRGPVRPREKEISNLLNSVTSQVQSCDLSDSENKEIKKLKDRLLESEKQKNQLAEELKIVKQEAKAAVEEARVLRSRIHLAEVAQRQARGVEMDYEEVIRLLEVEIAELRDQLVDHSGHNKDNTQDLQRRITVLGCQLRKSEMARKTFEVSTEKLLQFVESIPDVVVDEKGSTLNLCERIPAISSPLSRLATNRRGVLTSLVLEAKELARTVRSIVEVDCLPYGWEEAYTADGIKYFINHVTQTTSWSNPVTSALSLTAPENIREDLNPEPPDLKSCWKQS
ncbi:syntaxin-binding 4 isoform X2 [Pelobates cultripes]|uniref:Syntaxin-binding 4 isoform X2 n=2 Tax=Pelobates cultripes TaxID=61616 RepID=A0AAD1S3S9_PELCU|nr:syntaxin-binding 4 isoform X2 [Pelobates cultripes]